MNYSTGEAPERVCPHEGSHFSTKSECLKYGKWTNCREVGHCTLCPEAAERMRLHNEEVARNGC